MSSKTRDKSLSITLYDKESLRKLLMHELLEHFRVTDSAVDPKSGDSMLGPAAPSRHSRHRLSPPHRGSPLRLQGDFRLLIQCRAQTFTTSSVADGQG